MKFSIPEERLRKVVVRKAYDHVAFLAYMLDRMGAWDLCQSGEVGSRLRILIVLLYSSMDLPPGFFKVSKGRRHVDPVSSFLFTIAAESFGALFLRTGEQGLKFR